MEQKNEKYKKLLLEIISQLIQHILTRLRYIFFLKKELKFTIKSDLKKITAKRKKICGYFFGREVTCN